MLTGQRTGAVPGVVFRDAWEAARKRRTRHDLVEHEPVRGREPRPRPPHRPHPRRRAQVARRCGQPLATWIVGRRTDRRHVRLRPLRRRHRPALLRAVAHSLGCVILERARPSTPQVFEAGTGWAHQARRCVQGRPAGCACRCLRRRAPSDGRVDVTVVAERLGMPIVTDTERGRFVRSVPRPRSPAGRSPPRSHPSSSFPTRTATTSGFRACAGRRCFSSRGLPGEAAASTCPGGRPCARELHPTRPRDRHRSRLDVDPDAARPFIEAAAARASVAHRLRARRRRALRHRQRAERRVDRRGRA